MRNQLFRQVCVLLICGVVGLAAIAPAAQAKRKKDASRAKTISASGCITAGVESGCLILTDAKGTVYNLFFRGTRKPGMGSAIRFSGAPHDGPTTCMQGRAVNVRTWITLKMKCPKTGNSTGSC